MRPPIEMGEQGEVAVCLMVFVLLLQAVADEVVTLRLAACFRWADYIMVHRVVGIHDDSPKFDQGR